MGGASGSSKSTGLLYDRDDTEAAATGSAALNSRHLVERGQRLTISSPASFPPRAGRSIRVCASAASPVAWPNESKPQSHAGRLAPAAERNSMLLVSPLVLWRCRPADPG